MSILEKWKPIVGYEGLYEVSNRGRVRRLTSVKGFKAGDRLLGSLREDGYISIALRRDNKTKLFLLHQIVAESFLGPCPPGYTIDHVDGNKFHNQASNFEYVT